MLIVPLQPVPNQAVTVNLNGQVCQIDVYQENAFLYLDLYVSNALIIGGVICQNLNRIVWSLYLGFQGDLAFTDNMGNSDPVYTGLGPTSASQYNLLYIMPTELGGLG